MYLTPPQLAGLGLTKKQRARKLVKKLKRQEARGGKKATDTAARLAKVNVKRLQQRAAAGRSTTGADIIGKNLYLDQGDSSSATFRSAMQTAVTDAGGEVFASDDWFDTFQFSDPQAPPPGITEDGNVNDAIGDGTGPGGDEIGGDGDDWFDSFFDEMESGLDSGGGGGGGAGQVIDPITGQPYASGGKPKLSMLKIGLIAGVAFLGYKALKKRRR